MEEQQPLQDLEEALREHVIMLSERIGERGCYRYHNLTRAAVYISDALKKMGYDPEEHHYTIGNADYHNIIATREGRTHPEQIIIAGAHYDTVPGTPGADDNASGVAGILELARFFLRTEPDKTVQFIAFVNEEPPFYRTSKMGSRVFTKAAKKRKENIIAMFSFEMIGFFSDEKGSQHYPFGITMGYPDRANFISIVGDLRSRKFVREAAQIFRKHSLLDIQWVSMPRFIAGIEFSDHWSFWKAGYRAAMITDTAFYRYAHYHSPFDTHEKLDYRRMAQVVTGFYHVLDEMSR